MSDDNTVGYRKYLYLEILKQHPEWRFGDIAQTLLLSGNPMARLWQGMTYEQILTEIAITAYGDSN
jgi:hypothetical protein